MSEEFPYPDGFQVDMGPFCWNISVGHDEHWRESEQVEADHYGYTDNVLGRILINRHSTVEFRKVIVLHELMHAAFFSSGGIFNKKMDEERWVQHTAPMLLDALQCADDEFTHWLTCNCGGGNPAHHGTDMAALLRGEIRPRPV